MDKICLNGIKHSELVSQMVDITGADEKVIEQSIEVLKQVLPADKELPEYFIEKEESIPGVMGFHIPETKYYVSLSRGTISFVLFILDKFLMGIPSVIDNLAGISKKGIWKIKDNQYCIVDEIIRKGKSTIYDMKKLYDDRSECCNRSEIWKCPFLSEEHCLLKAEEVEALIEELISSDLINEDEGILTIVK